MKYAPSALIGRLSRSAGATTASHNRFGAYLRNRVIPTNPQTEKQTAARAAFSNAAAAWRSLTDAQRLAWRDLGEQMTSTDSLGQVYTLTGINAFQSIRRNNLTYGQAFSPTAPVLDTPTTIVTATLTAEASASLLTLAYTATPLGASTKLAIFAAPPVSAGINFVAASRFKLIMVTAAAAASPATLTTAYEALFGTMAVGEKIFIRAIAINAAGFAAPPVEVAAIVVAGS